MMGPRSMEPGCTRQLISRYEAIDNNTLSSLPPSTPPSFSLKRPFSPPRKKEKSPIRQSFHNLLALLKKKNNKSYPEYPQHPKNLLQDSSSPDKQAATKSSRTAFSGSLWYLSQPSFTPANSPILPVWIMCTATLDEKSLSLSWLTTGGNPDNLSIALEHCTDVRSSTQLNADELALLPNQGNGEDVRLFELVFEGRPREKFAASSVRERASWVSAIWDIVLQIQEIRSTFRLDRALQTFIPDPSNLCEVIPLIPDTGKPLPKVQERNLPAIPQPSPQSPVEQTGPEHIMHKTPLVTSRLHSRTLSTSSASVSHSPRSPSIANLSQRSMVKHRLAQLERHQSETASPTSPVSRYRNQSFNAPSIGTKSRFSLPNEEMLQPENTGIESIVDCYTITHPSYLYQESAPSGECWRSAETVNSLQDENVFSDREPQGDQFLSLRQDIQEIPHKFAAIRAHQDIPVLDDIRHSISNVDQQVNSTSQALHSINEKLAGIRQRIDLNAATSNAKPIAPDDVAGILRSLDDLRGLLTSDVVLAITRLEDACRQSSPVGESSTSKDIPLNQLTEILALLKDGREEHISQGQQQADCVRYLNELNTWLEAFVNNGTSQVQTLTTSFQQLCSTLGCTPSSDGDQGNNFVSDIQRINQDLQSREQNSAQLHAILGNISTHLDAGSTLTPQILAEIMDRQRQDHEGLLRMVTAELSNEIKGERLRFVEAMKEATAINVQTQVEEFKKELKREVQGMTQEVGRLHRERQMVENQIADLFAFYAKQKNDPASSMSMSGLEYVYPSQQNIQLVPRGLQTPLPSPGRGRQSSYH